jgi:hypothetical protein
VDPSLKENCLRLPHTQEDQCLLLAFLPVLFTHASLLQPWRSSSSSCILHHQGSALVSSIQERSKQKPALASSMPAALPVKSGHCCAATALCKCCSVHMCLTMAAGVLPTLCKHTAQAAVQAYCYALYVAQSRA